MENITIEKREITVNKEEFIKALVEYTKLYKKHNRSVIAIGFGILKNEFNLKLKGSDWYVLANFIGLSVWRSQYFLVDNILKLDSE